MIRVYGFYSCGGYKDMYLGNSERCDRPTYYLPLLPVMKERRRLEDLPKIEQQEKLQQIRLVTRRNSMGFPDECDVMFSHGGYVAIYRMLSNGSTCLAMRDIPSPEVDEVGRNIPFNILLIATDLESIAKLDQMAMSVKNHYVEWRDFATSLFTYDPYVNGVKFDLPTLFERLAELPKADEIQMDHSRNALAYLMLAGINNVGIAMREQNLQPEDVRCIVDMDGQILQGHFPLINRRGGSEPEYVNEAIHAEEVKKPAFGEKATLTGNVDATRAQEKRQKLEDTVQIVIQLQVKVEALINEVKALRDESMLRMDNLAKALADLANKIPPGDAKPSLLGTFLPDKFLRHKEDYLLIGLIIIILMLIFK